jgi:hypothetical protein
MSQQQQQVQQYFEAVTKGYDALQQAVEANMSRSSESVQALEKEVAAGQREAIVLSKKLTEEASDPTAVFGVLVSTSVAAQTRALNFVRLAYDQANRAGSDASTQLEQISQAAQQVNDAAFALTREVPIRSTGSVDPATHS